MPNYHPLYESASGELVLRINDEYALGSFRKWAKFTHKATRLCVEQRTELSNAIIDAVLATS